MLHGSERVNMKKKRRKHIRKERESGMKTFISKIDVLCNTLSTFVHVNRETGTSNYLRKTNTQKNHNSYKQGILTNRHLSPSIQPKISIALTSGFLTSSLGTVTVRTPFSIEALT